MKLAFDEHLPPAMASVFRGLANSRGIQRLCPDLAIVAAKDYAPAPEDVDYIKRNDAPWVRRFAADGGDVIVSGDNKMQTKLAERDALIGASMVVFFFAPAWNNMPFCDKCAMLLRWWPTLLETAARAPRPSFWRVPAVWKDDAGIVQVAHHDLRLEKIERQKAAKETVAAERRRRRTSEADPSQIKLQLGPGGKRRG